MPNTILHTEQNKLFLKQHQNKEDDIHSYFKFIKTN